EQRRHGDGDRAHQIQSRVVFGSRGQFDWPFLRPRRRFFRHPRRLLRGLYAPARPATSPAIPGSLKTFPGFVTAIVGRAETMLDQRDLDPDFLATMYRAAREGSERFAREEECTWNGRAFWSIEAVPFHPTLIDLCAAAHAGIPIVMMFQSVGGISHN